MSSNDDSSGSDLQLSPSTKTALQYIGIASFAGLLLFFFICYIRDLICDRRRRNLASATAPAIHEARNGGLHLDDISLLPKFIFRPSQRSFRKEKHNHDHKVKPTLFAECAVCISELEDGDVVRVLPTCKHFFHVKCIDMWLCTHSTCPMCRAHPEPEKVKLGMVSASPPLPQLRRCGTMPERKESINLSSCLGSPFMKTLSRGNSPYWHGSSLRESPCMFTPPRALSQEGRIEVRGLDDSEIREIIERVS